MLPDFSALSQEEMQEQLRDLAGEIVASIRAQAPECSQELLSAFVSELFVCATRQSILADRREKQAKGIAAAKARGVRFGPRTKPLPDNFNEALLAWRSKQMSLRQAAKLCGMPQSSFYDAVQRAEKQGGTHAFITT